MSGFRPRFFIGSDSVDLQVGSAPGEGAELVLSRVDSHHALHVLRLKAGDPCEVVVGAAAYSASISKATDPVQVLLAERLEGQAGGASYRFRVGLVQALIRPALLDQVLDKGTEVGSNFFILAAAAGSVRGSDLLKPSRIERWQRIALEASKQSKQLKVPTVESASSLEEVRDMLSSQRMLSLALEPSATQSLEEALEQNGLSCSERGGSGRHGESPAKGVALWVGPESGWSDDELSSFAAAGLDSARIGQSVLRAETAGPVAVAATRLVIGDW